MLEKEPKCVRCERFCWWDGDYCCLSKDEGWTILGSSPNGEFTPELLQVLWKKDGSCADFEESENYLSVELYEETLKEFLKESEEL